MHHFTCRPLIFLPSQAYLINLKVCYSLTLAPYHAYTLRVFALSGLELPRLACHNPSTNLFSQQSLSNHPQKNGAPKYSLCLPRPVYQCCNAYDLHFCTEASKSIASTETSKPLTFFIKPSLTTEVNYQIKNKETKQKHRD
jgi:hypothetical protein